MRLAVASAWRISSFPLPTQTKKITIMMMYPKNDRPQDSSSSSSSSINNTTTTRTKIKTTLTRLLYQDNATQALFQEGEQQQQQQQQQQTQSLSSSFSTSSQNNTNTNGSFCSPPPNNNYNLVVVGGGGGTLGDIMSSSNSVIQDDDGNTNAKLLLRDGLVTKESQSLAQAYQIHNPLDRMAITANGNLQRLFSSYYDSPVTVQVDYCRRRQNCQVQIPLSPPSANQSQASSSSFTTTTAAAVAAIWERQVWLQIFDNQTFCTATSVVVVHQESIEQLIESGVVGIGQLFRHFNVLPEFALIAAGPTVQGGFWRNYTLTSDQLVTCYIHEVFCPNVWNLQRKTK
jgi:hypothetical protein